MTPTQRGTMRAVALRARELLPVVRGFARSPLAVPRRMAQLEHDHAARQAVADGHKVHCKGERCSGCCRGEIPVVPSEVAAVRAAATPVVLARAREAAAKLQADPRAK